MKKDLTSIIVSSAVLVVFYAVAGYVLMLAWNLAVPQLFGMPTATWPNGVGLSLLVGAVKVRIQPAIAKP
jgi:hypothetical protein